MGMWLVTRAILWDSVGTWLVTRILIQFGTKNQPRAKTVSKEKSFFEEVLEVYKAMLGD